MQRLVLCVLLSVALASVPVAADACFNATRAQTDAWVRAIQSAEAALAAQKYARARASIEKLRERFRNDPGLSQRAHRVHALAVSRDPASTRNAREEAAREMALRGMRSSPETEPEPTEQADLAELLSRTASGQEAALQALRHLAAADLLGSAYAWAALARLETAAQQTAAAALAQQRCEKSALLPSICAR